LYLATSAFPAAIEMGSGNGRLTIITSMLLFHFAKRLLETGFLHKYTKKVNKFTSSFIGVYYALVCALIFNFSKTVSTGFQPATLPIGLGIFTIGQIGNLFHHWLLASLRSSTTPTPPKRSYGLSGGNIKSKSKSKSNGYEIPQGGLFKYVATPHYLFEVISWLGLAIVSSQLNVYLVALSMAMYLGGRSVSTTKWYRENLPNYPKDRKSMVPFIF
jgi:very-long-chain enoyl-CoA reductase